MRSVVLAVVLGAVVASGALAGTSGNEIGEVRGRQRFSGGNAIRPGRFAEVEIAVGDGISISDISGLARLPAATWRFWTTGKQSEFNCPQPQSKPLRLRARS